MKREKTVDLEEKQYENAEKIVERQWENGEIVFPRSGDEQFWRDFNRAYLNPNRLPIAKAREAAAASLRHRCPETIPPSVAQCRSYVRSIPKSLVAAARLEA